jgi:peptidoglycan-associated lipoprotein
MDTRYAMRWTAALALAVLAGCASDVRLDEPAPVESRTPAGPAGGAGGAAGSAGGAGGQSGVAQVDLTQRAADARRALEALPRVIYFDYDSYVVKDEYRSAIDAHARALAADRGRRLSIQGHTDERGGREYNLALGQRRAEAVARSLALLGAAENQVEAVSFGKERPAVSGADEASWAKNRRAELVYR